MSALRMALGGVVVIALWKLCGTDAYLGLGVPGISRALSDRALSPFAFAWKLVFTAVTLGTGFLGGEVTPLFFIGASLGNALSAPLGLPLDVTAALGLVGLFAACANTPLALAVMGVELFGIALLPYALLVSVTATLLSGRRGIYPSQRFAPTSGAASMSCRASVAGSGP